MAIRLSCRFSGLLKGSNQPTDFPQHLKTTLLARAFSDKSPEIQRFNIRDIPPSEYGGRRTVTLIPGDGIGPEMVSYAKEAIRYCGAPIDFEELAINSSSGEDEAKNAFLSVLRNGVALKGNLESNLLEQTAISRNVTLRKKLDLYANVVRCKSIPSYKTRHHDVDVVIIRENTEGEYSQLEHESVPGVVESLKIITAANSMRIAKYAFEYAELNNRNKVTAVHKANIMKASDGLFLDVCRQVALDYPDIEFNDVIIDNCAMQMVSNPNQFEVMVMPNLYGNIIANIGTGIVGGPGCTVGANIGDTVAIFEQGTRNSGRSIVGKNIANPSAFLLAASDMLSHIGHGGYGRHIYDSVYETLSHSDTRTPDLGGTATTLEVIQTILSAIKIKAEYCSDSDSDSTDDGKKK